MFAVATLLGTAGAMIARGQEPSVAGVWIGAITDDYGRSAPIKLMLRQDGEVVTGGLSNALIRLTDAPLAGTFGGRARSFTVPATEASWRATVEGDSMTGTAERNNIVGHFTATRGK